MFLPTIVASALAIRSAILPTPASTAANSGTTHTIGLVNRSTGLTVSTDARCGQTQTCSCSQYGWCGSTSFHSGAGCQPDYGSCDGAPKQDDSPAVPNLAGPSTTTLTLYTTVTPVPLSNTPPVFSSTLFSFAPSPSPSFTALGSGTYHKVFLGDGSPSAGWPLKSQWLDFETLWSTNLAAVIAKSCEQWNVPNNSPDESDALKFAIHTIASAHSIDPRFALAIALQESNGCVRAPTTVGSVSNPGIFQSYEGTGTCNKGGSVANPCPDSEIQQMVNDGITGTVPGSMSIVDAVKKAGGDGAEQYYRAARVYNSGSIAPSGPLQDGVATHCYATDIANRLLGWNNGPTECKLDG